MHKTILCTCVCVRYKRRKVVRIMHSKNVYRFGAHDLYIFIKKKYVLFFSPNFRVRCAWEVYEHSIATYLSRDKNTPILFMASMIIFNLVSCVSSDKDYTGIISNIQIEKNTMRLANGSICMLKINDIIARISLRTKQKLRIAVYRRLFRRI